MSGKQKKDSVGKASKAVVLCSESAFNEEDRQNLTEINSNMKVLLIEIQVLEDELAKSKAEVKK